MNEGVLGATRSYNSSVWRKLHIQHEVKKIKGMINTPITTILEKEKINYREEHGLITNINVISELFVSGDEIRNNKGNKNHNSGKRQKAKRHKQF